MNPMLQASTPTFAALAERVLLCAAAGVTVALCLLLLVATSNYIHFPRLRRQPLSSIPPAQPSDQPLLSILIPARNEAATIRATVGSLLAQSGAPDFELLVLDDQSSDGTAAAALAAGCGDARLRVISGAALPNGWVGKSWACHQLAGAAHGEWLLFTDADVQWEPGALAAVWAARAELGLEERGMLSVWPTQRMESWSERLVVPLMSFALLAYLPVVWVHGFPHKQAAAANGQSLLFKRETYAACGGHAGVRASLIEDVALAQRVKGAGHPLRLVDGAGLVQTRMYTSWPQVRDGYAKNILAGHLNAPALLLLSTAFHLGAFVAPWIWLALAGPGWLWLPLTMLVLGFATRTLTSATAGQPLRDVIWMPLGVLLMTRIAAQALWWRLRHGGVRWKGRTITTANQAR